MGKKEIKRWGKDRKRERDREREIRFKVRKVERERVSEKNLIKALLHMATIHAIMWERDGRL